MSARAIGLAVLAGVLGGLVAWGAVVVFRGDALPHNLADEVLLLPLAQRTAEPGLFAGDHWLDLAAEVFSIPYSYLLAGMLALIDDPVGALTALSAPIFAVFLTGTLLLTARIEGRNAAAVAGATVLGAALLSGPLLAAGSALPRDLVFALVPLFWLGVRGPATRRLPRHAALYLALGLVANLHPLTAVHLAIVLVLANLDVGRLKEEALATAVAVAAFAAGAAPFVYQYLTRPATDGAPPESVLHWRVGSIGAESLSQWVGRCEAPVLVLAATLLAARFLRAETGSEQQEEGRRRLVLLVALGVAIAALGPVVARFIDPLRPFQFNRLARFAYLGAVPVLAAAACRIAADPRTALRRATAWGATATILAALAGPPAVGLVRGGGGDRGPLAEGARVIERRAFETPPAPEPPPQLIRRDALPAPESQELLAEAFRDVCRFAREDTDPGDVFVVPPETWSAFRAYARRPAAVTRKDGGFALTFLGGRGADWLTEYADAVAAYAGDDEAWTRVLARHAPRFIVVEEGRPAPPVGRPVHLASPYAVYRLP